MKTKDFLVCSQTALDMPPFAMAEYLTVSLDLYMAWLFERQTIIVSGISLDDLEKIIREDSFEAALRALREGIIADRKAGLDWE